MQTSQRYYLDFTSDLYRSIHCYIQGNINSANMFIDHAQKILSTSLDEQLWDEFFPEQIRKEWIIIQKRKFGNAHFENDRSADKILTIASVIFYRTCHHALT